MSKLNFLLTLVTPFRLICICVFCALISVVFATSKQDASSYSKNKHINLFSKLESNESFILGSPNATTVFPTPTPEIPHTLVGSYYAIDNNTEAKLLLNNKGNSQLNIQPTLYNLQGQELQIPPVTVEPHSFRFINLRDWAAIGGDSFLSGNIKLFHYGKDLVLGAQIYLTDETHSLSFEEKLAELGKFDSRKQETVLAIPTQQTRIRIILTNTSNTQLSLTATPARIPNIVGNQHSFQLAAHETKVLDLRQDFINGNQFGDAEVVGMSLSHVATKDALLARVLIADPAKGYSNLAQFSNPDGGKSSEYQGVGFQIEDVAGMRLAPIIVARNVGNATATVTSRVPYTRTDGTRNTIILPPKQLTPGQIGLIDTRSIISRVQNEQIKIASLEVEYNTAPGSVVVASHSISTDGNQVFRVPMWDPLGQRSPTGGYPWRIEGTSTTQTYIKNITDLEEDYVAFLLWENGGEYMIGLKSIKPHETVNIDVKRLRDEQIPDERGRTIPPYISSGQLQWTLRRKDNLREDDMRAGLALIGRSEQVDTTKGIVNNYSCQNCCSGSYSNGYVSPGSGETEYGDIVQYAAYEEGVTCYNEPYFYQITNPTWSSSDQSVATIDGSGLATTVGAGSTQIKAKWYVWRYFENYPCGPGGPGLLEDEDSSAGCEKKESKEKTEIDPPTTNIAPCGTCIGTQSQIAPTSSLSVKPKVTLTVPATAKDGDTVTFSATVQGGTPTAYQWSFTAPSGSGNNPQVNFTTPTAASTNADAHWFANPNQACSPNTPSNSDPYYNSKYKIKINVTFQDGSQKMKDADFKVNAYWAPAGSVAPPTISGGPEHGYDTRRRLWVVTGSGTLQRNVNSRVIYVPSTSQFFHKTDEHEQVHEGQFNTGGLNADILTIAGLMSVLSPLTDSTEAGLLTKIDNASNTWFNSEQQRYNGRLSQAEHEAYVISDPISPQYAYQNCGRY